MFCYYGDIHMDVSRFLSKVIGIYLIIVSLSIIVNFPQFAIYLNDLLNNVSIMFITGFFTLILGILMVVSHNVWQWNWRLLITILSWVTLIKGSTLIFYPHFIDKATILFIQNSTMAYIAAIIDLFLGILLMYFGFKKS